MGHRLYSNENFPLPVVLYLRQMGHDVTTSQESRQANLRVPDREVLHFAISQDRALLTLNRRDFILLHNQNSDHAGIIVCRVDADYQALSLRIHQSIDRLTSLHNQLIRVNRPG